MHIDRGPVDYSYASETTPPEPTKSLEHPLLVPLLIMAAIILAASYFIPKLLISRIAHGLQKQKLNFDIDIDKLTVPLVLRAALIEAIVILGLVITLSSADMQAFYIFWGVALVSFFLSFPTQSRIEKWLSGGNDPFKSGKASSARLS